MHLIQESWKLPSDGHTTSCRLVWAVYINREIENHCQLRKRSCHKRMCKGLREGRALFYIRLEINPAGNVDKDTSHVALDFSCFFRMTAERSPELVCRRSSPRQRCTHNELEQCISFRETSKIFKWHEGLCNKLSSRSNLTSGKIESLWTWHNISSQTIKLRLIIYQKVSMKFSSTLI